MKKVIGSAIVCAFLLVQAQPVFAASAKKETVSIPKRVKGQRIKYVIFYKGNNITSRKKIFVASGSSMVVPAGFKKRNLRCFANGNKLVLLCKKR